MFRSWWAFAASALLVVGVLVLVSGGKYPPMPDDGRHGGLESNEACSACHAPGAEAPLASGHPPKEQCLRCHNP